VSDGQTPAVAPADAVAAKLAEIRARRAEIAAARSAYEAATAAERELAEETQALADEQAIQAAELEHGLVGRKIAVVKTDAGVIIVKRPHMNTFRKFQDHGEANTETNLKLVRPCVVYPDLVRFDEILAEVPYALSKCANAVSYLAGFRKEDLTVK